MPGPNFLAYPPRIPAGLWLPLSHPTGSGSAPEGQLPAQVQGYHGVSYTSPKSSAVGFFRRQNREVNSLLTLMPSVCRECGVTALFPRRPP
jgi:hypothetical protein